MKITKQELDFIAYLIRCEANRQKREILNSAETVYPKEKDLGKMNALFKGWLNGDERMSLMSTLYEKLTNAELVLEVDE